jgi:cytochrome c2
LQQFIYQIDLRKENMQPTINLLVLIFSLSVLNIAIGEEYSEESLRAADMVSGEQTWQQYCAFCHTAAEGRADITGPNLHKLFKRKVGTKSGFAYSDALKNDKRDWTPALFADYVQDPGSVIPGNVMPAVDIPEDKVLALTSYLMRISDSVDWDQAKAGAATGGLDAELKVNNPEFWDLYMNNTVKFSVPYEDRTYSFVVYFNEDGTISGNNRGLTGIWRMRDKRNFCFAMQRIGVHPYEWMHCIKPKVIKNMSFGEVAAKIKPVKGYNDFEVDLTFIEGRPHPLEGDAHPDYWTFLFSNTMRYEIKVNGEVFIVNALFSPDNTIDSLEGITGKWRTEGEDGKKDRMCYSFSGVPGVEGDLTECFALVLMFNPRVGARWPARFEQGNTYWSEVFAGRE